MKAFIAFSLFCTFANSLKREDQIPKFSWIQTAEPVLKITYPNGGSDLVTLKPFNPIPLQSGEREEDVDSCIYDGFMANEKDVYVTVTGCALSDTFNVRHS